MIPAHEAEALVQAFEKTVVASVREIQEPCEACFSARLAGRPSASSNCTVWASYFAARDALLNSLLNVGGMP